MKHPLLKSVIVLGTALVLVNCGDETLSNAADAAANVNIPAVTPPAEDPVDPSNIAVNEPSWVISTDKTYLISTYTMVVTDVAGTPVGVYDPASQTIIDLVGTPLVENVDFTTLPIVLPQDATPITPDQPSNPVVNDPVVNNPVENNPVINDPSTNPTNPNNPVVKPASSSSVKQNNTASSSSVANNNTPKSSSSAQQQQQQGGNDGTCFDKANNKYVKPYDNLNVNGVSYAYKEDCSINCYYDPQGKNCASIGSSTGSNNNQQQASSSSQQQPKSSSSQVQQQPKSSSSQGTTGGTTGSNYTIKYVSGGKSGSGWATRYWDCCKPHCAWPGKGGIQAHACDASGNRISDDGATSMCDGGNSGTCKSQIPIVVNDNLAFAFAAVPGSAGGECGKCFDLEFTGKGKYATDNHTALKGKHLIVIASNIGYDVADGQFDIMIPGGGFGIFDGCSAKMGWGSQGARYGGLLTECEESSGYKASTYKSCLTSKCNASFSSDPVAKEGCLFLANWMNAAGNPLHNFREVECPKELLDKF